MLLKFWAERHTSLMLLVQQWSRHVLRRQLGCSKPLHHFRQGHRRPLESIARSRRWRHGHGYSQKGKAGVEEERHASISSCPAIKQELTFPSVLDSDASSRGAAVETVAKVRRRLPVL